MTLPGADAKRPQCDGCGGGHRGWARRDHERSSTARSSCVPGQSRRGPGRIARSRTSGADDDRREERCKAARRRWSTTALAERLLRSSPPGRWRRGVPWWFDNLAKNPAADGRAVATEDPAEARREAGWSAVSGADPRRWPWAMIAPAALARETGDCRRSGASRLKSARRARSHGGRPLLGRRERPLTARAAPAAERLRGVRGCRCAGRLRPGHGRCRVLRTGRACARDSSRSAFDGLEHRLDVDDMPARRRRGASVPAAISAPA